MRVTLGKVLDELRRSGSGNGLAVWFRKCLADRSQANAIKLDGITFHGEIERIVCAVALIRQLSMDTLGLSRTLDVMKCFDSHVLSRGPNRDPIGLAREFVHEHVRLGHECRPFLAAASGPKIGPETLTRVMSHSAVEYVLVAALGASVGSRLSPARVMESYRRLKAIAVLTYSPIGELRGNLPGFWFTTSAELDSLETDIDTAADATRNALGLGHFTRGNLYRLRFAPSPSLEPKTPTVFDCPFGEFFCPVDQPDRWGRTRVLPKMADAGLLEGIAASCPWPVDTDMDALGSLGANLQARPDSNQWDTYIHELWVDLSARDAGLQATLADLIS